MSIDVAIKSGNWGVGSKATHYGSAIEASVQRSGMHRKCLGLRTIALQARRNKSKERIR